jgi:purine-binding chemotaxis protein CheW
MEGSRNSPSVVEEILAQRAAALAKPVEEEAPADTLHLVLLVLGEERYGVDVTTVLGVEPVPELTPIPGAPSPWIGVINIRGTLVPVLDTHAYMETRTDEPATEEAKVVLVSDGRMTVGLLVDDVANITRVSADAIRPAIGGKKSQHADVVRGVTPEMAAILDVEKLLSEASLVVDQGPVAQGGTRG